MFCFYYFVINLDPFMLAKYVKIRDHITNGVFVNVFLRFKEFDKQIRVGKDVFGVEEFTC